MTSAESPDGEIPDAVGRLPSLSRLRRTLPLAQTRFQSPRPTHPVGRGRARGPARVPSCALGVTHRGRSGALDLGERWARLGRPRLSHFEMRASPAPQVSCLTRRVVTSWLLKARARRKRRGGRGAVICRCVTAYWAEVSAGKTPTHTHAPDRRYLQHRRLPAVSRRL